MSKQVSILLTVTVEDAMTFEGIDGLVRDMLDCPEDGFFRIESVTVREYPFVFESQKNFGIEKRYGDDSPEWLIGDRGRWTGTEEEAKAKAEYLTGLVNERMRKGTKLTYTPRKLFSL
jgi:hypothetical protein